MERRKKWNPVAWIPLYFLRIQKSRPSLLIISLYFIEPLFLFTERQWSNKAVVSWFTYMENICGRKLKKIYAQCLPAWGTHESLLLSRLLPLFCSRNNQGYILCISIIHPPPPPLKLIFSSANKVFKVYNSKRCNFMTLCPVFHAIFFILNFFSQQLLIFSPLLLRWMGMGMAIS